jgi:hypothetical protein
MSGGVSLQPGKRTGAPKNGTAIDEIRDLQQNGRRAVRIFGRPLLEQCEDRHRHRVQHRGEVRIVGRSADWRAGMKSEKRGNIRRRPRGIVEPYARLAVAQRQKNCGGCRLERPDPGDLAFACDAPARSR